MQVNVGGEEGEEDGVPEGTDVQSQRTSLAHTSAADKDEEVKQNRSTDNNNLRWYILLKWCIHLSRSLYFNYNYLEYCSVYVIDILLPKIV